MSAARLARRRALAFVNETLRLVFPRKEKKEARRCEDTRARQSRSVSTSGSS
jgi:hypothetical protein